MPTLINKKSLLFFLVLMVLLVCLNSVYIFNAKAENGSVNTDSQIGIAEDHFNKGDFDNALKMYENIIKTYPDNSRFRLILAKIYIEKTNFEQAKEQLLKAIKINPGNAEAHYYLASIFSLLGDYKQTINECVKALEIDPQFYVARLLLADAYMYDLNDVRSEEELKKLLVVTPDSLSVHWRLGQIYSQLQGDLDKSIIEMEKAVSLKSDVSKLYGELGGAYLRSFDFKKGLENFQKSVEINPRNIESQYGLGQAYQYLDRLDEALQRYKIVLEKQPRNLWLLQEEARIYYQKGDYERLQKVCLEGIEYYPRNPGFHFLLGIAYYLTRGIDHVAKAKEQLETTLQLKPNYPQAKEWLENVSKLLKDYQAISDKLANIQQTSHYVFKTNLSEVVLYRLVQEGKADQIFEDAKAFFSKLLKRPIEMPPINVSIFNQNEDFKQYYQFKYGQEVVGRSIAVLNEIVIDGSGPLSIEHVLLHETAHAILSKNIPNLPEWLGEALSGGLLFSTHWGIDTKYLTELMASPGFAELNGGTIIEQAQDPRIYYLFGNFLLSNYYSELEQYIQLLRKNKNSKDTFLMAFRDKQKSIGTEFQRFIRDLTNKMVVLNHFQDFSLRRISYGLGHYNQEPEDILIYMLSDYKYYIAKVLLLENNITAERFKSFVKKENKPYYGNFSKDAERFLLLASEKLRGKKESSISIDEYLLILLEDKNNKVMTMLKEMGVDTLNLHKLLLRSLEKFKDGKARFFSLVPKATLPGTSVTLFCWLSPEDKETEVLLNNFKLGKLRLYEKGPYEKTGLMRYPLTIPDTLKSGLYNLDIKNNGEIIQNLSLVVTDRLSSPLVEKVDVFPDWSSGVLFRNLSRLKFHLVYWNKKFVPLFSFKQNNKIFFVNGTITDEYLEDILSVDLPKEVQVGDVEVSLQAVLGKENSQVSDPVSLKVFEQKSPKIISLNKYTFFPGEKILIKGENFARSDKVNEVIIGPCTVRAYLQKKDKYDTDDTESLLSELMDSSMQTLEVEIPNDKGLYGKISVKVKTYDEVSNEISIEVVDILKK